MRLALDVFTVVAVSSGAFFFSRARSGYCAFRTRLPGFMP